MGFGGNGSLHNSDTGLYLSYRNICWIFCNGCSRCKFNDSKCDKYNILAYINIITPAGAKRFSEKGLEASRKFMLKTVFVLSIPVLTFYLFAVLFLKNYFILHTKIIILGMVYYCRFAVSTLF